MCVQGDLQREGKPSKCAQCSLLCAEEDNSDALRETFILRKTSLRQDQWDKYLSSETAKAANEETNALLGGKSRSTLTSDGAVTSKKRTTFDVETGESTSKLSRR